MRLEMPITTIGLDDGLAPTGDKLLSEPMMIQFNNTYAIGDWVVRIMTIKSRIIYRKS